MVMIVHEAVGMTAPPKPIDHLGKASEEGLAVGLSFHNGLARIASAGDMIQRMFKLKP